MLMPRITFKNTILFTLALVGCSCANHPVKDSKPVLNDSIRGLTIQLGPSFINFSTIDINRTMNKMSFTVFEQQEMKYTHVTPFTIRLDSFEAGTGIQSFYDTVFTSSIKQKPDQLMFVDGIDITSFFYRGSKTDTVYSGNSFSKKLSDNLVGQINFISNRTTDTTLKAYLVELKEYFN